MVLGFAAIGPDICPVEMRGSSVEHGLWIAAHILAAGYWLGTDLAVYHLSGAIGDGRQPAAVRAWCAKAMLWLDMVPRTCLVLTFAIGVTLAIRLGLLVDARDWLLPLWIGSAAWLALTWAVFRLEHSPPGQLLARIDFGLRIVVVAGCLVAAIDAWAPGGALLEARWLAAKLAIFGGVVALGLVIRVQLRPFGALFARSLGPDATEADRDAVASLIRRVKVPVWFIWAGVAAAVVLGAVKPG